MSLPNLQEVLNAAQVGESADWEFKSAKGGLPRSLWETYSAMANTEGGVVVLGAVERDEKVRLDGLTAPEAAKVRKELWDNLNNRGKVSVNLLRNEDVGVIPLGEAQLIVLRIPRASRTQRPVYLGPTPLGNTYRRQHEGDYRCADDEVRRMLADADPLAPDHRVLEHFSLEDLDSASLTQYRQRFRAAKGDHPWLALENRDLLEKLGA
ncbi:MAG: ATP-binding protein [Verrucomicrobiae bacterium]|nr:ATP-binding protein [Verrucomicrobiae bacterium]